MILRVEGRREPTNKHSDTHPRIHGLVVGEVAGLEGWEVVVVGEGGRINRL